MAIARIKPICWSLYHFNHMIVRIEFNQKDYYFDPTIKKQAGDLFNNATLDYGYGLILSKAGHSLKKLPHDFKRKVFSLKHIFDFSKTSSEDNLLTIRRSFYAHRADNMRYYLNSKERELLSNEFLKYAKDDADLDLTIVRPITIVKDDSVQNILETEEIYTIENLTDADHNRTVQVPTTIYMDFPTTATDIHPIRIDLDGGIAHEIEVIYKDKRDVPKYDEEKIVENPWFFYRDTVSTKENKIWFRSSAVPHSRFVESKDLKTYLADVEQLRQRNTSNFPYKTGNYASIYKMAGNMALSASFIFIIMLFLVKFQ